MSNYRDDLGAAQTRAAALEEDLEERDQMLEEREARIAELEKKLADTESARRSELRTRPTPSAEPRESERDAPADDLDADAKPKRQRLIPLEPQAGPKNAAVVGLILVGVVFLVIVVMGR